MIRNRMKPFVVKSRTSTLDDYGQLGNTFTTIKTIDVCVTLDTQSLNNTDIRYKDATHIGLTTDKTLTDNMTLTNGTTIYQILLVNNDGKYSQLKLCEAI